MTEGAGNYYEKQELIDDLMAMAHVYGISGTAQRLGVNEGCIRNAIDIPHYFAPRLLRAMGFREALIYERIPDKGAKWPTSPTT